MESEDIKVISQVGGRCGVVSACDRGRSLVQLVNRGVSAWLAWLGADKV